MPKLKIKVKNLLAIIAALFLGLLGANLITSEFSYGETPIIRFFLIFFHYFISGFIVGLISASYRYSILVSWFPVFIGLFIIIGGIGKSPVDFLVGSFLFTPIYICIFAAIWANKLRKKIKRSRHKK